MNYLEAFFPVLDNLIIAMALMSGLVVAIVVKDSIGSKRR